MTTVMTRAEKELEQIALWENMETVDQITGTRELEPKIRLVGVPFIISSVTFRPDKSGKRDYISVEAITAPAVRFNHDKIVRYRASSTRKIPSALIEEIGYVPESYADPGADVVFNDSSTGVRRQIVAYLSAKKLIDVGVKGEIDRLDGSMGENPFDTYAQEWKSGGDRAMGEGFQIRLLCPNGLRVSCYENEFSGMATTFYLS